MSLREFIKLDKEIIYILLALLILSCVISIFVPASIGPISIPGSARYLCDTKYAPFPECTETSCFITCSGGTGLGFPFMWCFIRLSWSGCIGEVCALGAGQTKTILFDPVNFVLDMVILYVLAVLIRALAKVLIRACIKK